MSTRRRRRNDKVRGKRCMCTSTTVNPEEAGKENKVVGGRWQHKTMNVGIR